MKLVAMPDYGKHRTWRGCAPGGIPAVHAMMRKEMVVVDLNSFLYARVACDDAVYPLEPEHDGSPLIQVWFRKGGVSTFVDMPAYEFKRIFRTDPPRVCR